MAWLDSTDTNGQIDTDDQSSPCRIDLSQNVVTEYSELQKSNDSDNADTTATGGGFFVRVKRTRTITQWKYIGLTQTYAKTVATRFATDSDEYGLPTASIIESNANRINAADGWAVSITTDTKGNWELA
jgi:hypothetical protein